MSDDVWKWADDTLRFDDQSLGPKLAPYQRQMLEALVRGDKIDLDKIAATQTRAWKTHINKLLMMEAARSGQRVFAARLEDGQLRFDEITSGMPYDEL